MHIRPATLAHLPGIVEIENREIAENFAHFGQTAGTLEQCQASFQAAQGKYPWFVATEDDTVAGYAKSGPWRVRESYQFSVEIGVYIRPEHQGKGIAKALYAELLPALREAGFKTIVAGVAQPNPISDRLHQSLGMQFAGTLPNVGFKFGKWISVSYWVLHWE